MQLDYQQNQPASHRAKSWMLLLFLGIGLGIAAALLLALAVQWKRNSLRAQHAAQAKQLINQLQQVRNAPTTQNH